MVHVNVLVVVLSGKKKCDNPRHTNKTPIIMRWLIYSFILRYPTAALCILAFLLTIVFSNMIGWPAFVFLGICVLMFIINLFIDGNSEKFREKIHSDIELDSIEKKNRWIMGMLSVFALSGIIVSMHLTINSLEYAANSATVIGAMALFHFSLIGIPYILMNMVKRRNSFWYGLMTPLLMAAIIQFMICSMLAESNDEIIARYTSVWFEHIHGNWIIIGPLLFLPVIMFLDSLGKAFGFKVKDDTFNMGYDKEKHKSAIVNNKKLSAIGISLSFIWSVLSLWYCYYFVSKG